ncbi:MAG: hypothetical protein IMX01_02000 [Limnochordaceae bacterium]|nr:hypothetical protein [Limnochordaceae bacterium]
MYKGRVYFLEAYLAYLLQERVAAEERAVGDASRFCRFLLSRTRPDDIEEFLQRTDSLPYRRQVRRSLERFLAWMQRPAPPTVAPIRTSPVDRKRPDQ